MQVGTWQQPTPMGAWCCIDSYIYNLANKIKAIQYQNLTKTYYIQGNIENNRQ